MNLLWSFVVCTLLAVASAQTCQVRSLQLSQADNTLIASWNVDGSADGCSFEVQLSSDAETQSSETVSVNGVTEYQFPNRVPCSTVSVEVSSSGQGVSETIIIDTSVTDAPILREMITSCDSIEMIWDAQPYIENMCEVTHFQMFCLSDTHNFTIPQGVTDVRERTFDIIIRVLRPDIYYTCNGFIFTTLGGFSPASDNIEFWSNLDSVRDLRVKETENSISAIWEAPLNSEECGVAYEVTYENEVLGSSSIEVVGLSHQFDIPLISCTDYKITVTPLSFTGTKGTAVSKEIGASLRIGDVNNVEVQDATNALILSWTAADVGLCEVSYNLHHLVDGVTHETIESSDTSFRFDRIPCALSTFVVEPVSQDETGNAATVDIELGVADITWIGSVSNVQLEDDLLVWEAPTSVGLCSISYRVVVENSFGTSERIVSDTSAALGLIPCLNNIIGISGISNDVVGNALVLEISAPSAEFSAPEHIRTEPDFTSATITLQADTFDINACNIGVVDVQCSDASGAVFERSIPIDDDESRTFTVEVEDLTLDTIYDCYARWENSDAGDVFSFRTIPLTPKTLSVSNIGESSFLVSWTENYGRAFVNDYTLIVETLGPLHAIRDGCDVERNVIRTYEVDGDTQNLEFVQASPDFQYRVVLVTNYTLGVEVESKQLSVATATGVPDLPEDLSYELVQGDGGYNVNAVLSWVPPCQLNGELQGFTAKIVGSFEFAGIDQRVEIDVEISGDGDQVNSNFAYELNNLNPFFKYDISLATEAAVRGDDANLSIDPPGACFCEIES